MLRIGFAGYLRVLSVIAALGIAMSFSARAQDDKPAAFVKTPYVEITVTIAKELNAYPQLYSALLIEAKSYAEKTRKETYAAWIADKPLFHGGSWTFDRGYRLRAAVSPYVSVIVDTGD